MGRLDRFLIGGVSFGVAARAHCSVEVVRKEITGNLLGLMLGAGAIPEKWLAELELREEIVAVAGDLFKQFEDKDAWRHRYPG
jgi:hypothetical protein